MSDGKNNSSGFMWGLLIGGALGSLVSTKKGRRIIKELTEHGFESLENIVDIDKIKETIDKNEFVKAIKEEAEEEKEEMVKKKPRLFRGIKK